MTELEQKIGFVFNDRSLLAVALTHSSIANEQGLKSNQRLEYLGDSVLNMLVADFLFRNCSGDEGELTELRKGYVCEDNLRRVCDSLKIAPLLRCSKGLVPNDSIKADMVEAVIGALYLDSGIDSAREFINKYILKTK